MFWIAVCFALGEAYAVAAGHSAIITGLMIMAALVLAFADDRTCAAMLFYRRKPERKRYVDMGRKKIMAVSLIFGLTLLMGYINVYRMAVQKDFAEKLVGKTPGQAECEVYDIRETSSGYQVYVHGTKIDTGNLCYAGSTDMILYTKDADGLRMGQRLLVKGDMARPDKATNPGEFDARSYYESRGIYVICRNSRVMEKSTSYSLVRDSLYRIRLCAGKQIDRVFKAQDASVIRAMLLGEKSEIDKDTKRLFQMNGIAHILAISGVHIAIIGMTLFKLLRRLNLSNLSAGISAVGVIVLYGIMTGLASSTFRAVIMMILVVAAKVKGRSPDMLTSAGIACVIQAFVNPYTVLDPGFQLSFAAVMGIAVINPMLTDIMGQVMSNRKKGDETEKRGGVYGFIRKAASMLLINISVTLATTPIVIYYYYQFPLYSVALNMIIVPFVSILILGSIILLVMGMIAGDEGILIFVATVPIESILRMYRWLCQKVSLLPGYNINVGHITPEMVVVFYVVIFVVLYTISGLSREKNEDEQGADKIYVIRKVALLLVILAAGTCFECASYDRNFKVIYMDVGQGDGILIRSEMGINIMIDGGSTDRTKVGEYVVAPVLRYYGAAHVDYVFLTHSDTDHTSGILELLQTENTGVSIDNIVLPQNGLQEGFGNIKAAASAAGVNVIYMKTGDRIDSGTYDIDEKSRRKKEKLSLKFLYPGGETGINDVNDLSSVIRLDYLQYSMLFTGDAGEAAEQRLLEDGTDIRADVLKVGHHGSRYSSSPEFLDAVSPRMAVISAGKDNRYGHPHKETVKKLENRGIDVLCTIQSGAVSVEIDREGLKVSSFD